MSRELDERVVAMYFDNANFERNAQKTIKTLDELKQSCNMDGVGKGFEALDNVGKKLNFDKLTSGAKKFKSVIGTFGDTFKKAFGLGMIDDLKRGIDDFNHNYLTKIFGFDLANKIVGSLENAFRNLTIAPISAGWSQYENTMDSVKTIMSSTGASIQEVNSQLNHMTEYANQTIYSLNDMTSNLGKFTNNGVKLEDATNAMIGLANATADAGQGAASASMAMYNVSQAIGVGKMTTIDWKSLENANIATQRLKQTFIDAAVAEGKLEKRMVKDSATGKEMVEYWTKAENGVKATKVSVENFRETLNSGWLTKEAMMDTFAIYSGELSVAEIAAMGFTEDEAERLYQLGLEAKNAATEVRTFTKMMDALRESVQSSWATTFQYIFGDMEEGTNLWSLMNDKIDSVLSAGAEHRNNILMSWRGMMKDENGEVKRIEDVYKWSQEQLIREHNAGVISDAEFGRRMNELKETLGNPELWVDYRQMLIDAILGVYDENGVQIEAGLVDTLMDLGSMIKSAWTDIFGEFNADTLKKMTKAFTDFIGKIKDWLGSTDDADSRMSKLKRIFEGLFSVVKVGITFIKTGIQTIWAFIKPIIDPVLNVLARIGDFLNLKNISGIGDIIRTLVDRFKALWNTLKQLGFSGVMTKIGDWFKDLWEKIKTGVREFLVENGLEGVVTWFEGIGESLKSAYLAVEKWWNESGVGDFFRGIWESVVNLFTAKEDGSDVPIVKFFKGIAGWLSQAWEDAKTALTSWINESGIGQFFANLWNSIVGLFEQKVDLIYYDSTGRHELHGTSPIVQFFYDVGDAIKGAYDWLVGLQVWTDIGNFFSGVWKSVSGLFEPKKVRTGIEIDEWGKRQSVYEEQDAPIVSFFKGIYEGLQSIWETITNWWNTSGVGDFFRNAWEWIVAQVTPVQMDDGTVAQAPIIQFFDKVKTKVEEAWQAVKDFFISMDDKLGISKFFTDTWNWLMELLGISTDQTSVTYEPQVFKPGVKIDYSRLTASAARSDVGMGKKKQAKDIDSMEDIDDELRENVPIIDFFVRIYQALETAWNAVVNWEGWDTIGTFFSDMWKWIYDLFTSKDVITNANGETEEKKSLLESIGQFFKTLFESLADAIKDIGASPFAETLVDNFSSALVVVQNTISIILGFLEHFTNTLTGNHENGLSALEIIIPLILAVIGVLMKIAEARRLTKLTKIAEATGALNSFGMQILELAAAVFLITLAIEKIGNLPDDVLGKGIAFVAIIGVAIGIVMALITTLKKASAAGNKDDPQKAWERVVGKLISGLTVIGLVWIVFDKLPTIIDALAKAREYTDISGNDMMLMLLGIAGAISAVMLALAVVNKLAPKGLDPIATAKTGLSIIIFFSELIAALFATGGIIELIKGAIDLFGGDGEQAIKDVLKTVQDVFEGIAGIFNSFIQGLFGTGAQADEAKQEAAISQLTGLSEVADKFTLENTSAIARILSLMSRLTEVSKGVDVSRLNDFSSAAYELGAAMIKFAGVIDVLINGTDKFTGLGEKGSERFTQFEDALDFCKKFFDSFEPLSHFATAGYNRTFYSIAEDFIKFVNDGKAPDFVNAINAFIDAMTGENGIKDTSSINFDGIAIVNKLYDSIETVLENPEEIADLKFNATGIVDAILEALSISEPLITSGIHDMIQGGLDGLGSTDMSFDLGSLGDMTGVMDTVSQISDINIGQLGTNNGESTDILSLLGIDVSSLQTNMNAAIGELNQQEWNFDALDLPVEINTFTVDSDGDGVPDIIGSIESEWNSVTESLENGEYDVDLQLAIKPVFNLDDFPTEMARLRTMFSGEVPISMNATVSLGDNAVPIDDSKLVSHIDAVRQEVQWNRESMERELNNVTGNLGSRIDSLASHIDNLKLTLNSGALIGGIIGGVDNKLFDRSWQSEMTGVSPSSP